MGQAKIREASESLRSISDSVEGEVRERLLQQAAVLAELSEQDRGPDHGRVARHQQKLREIKRDEPATADAVDAAVERLNEYRETVEGV